MPADADDLPALFRTRGFVTVPGLLDAARVEAYVRILEVLSGRPRESFGLSGAGRRRRRRLLYGAWTLPDGVSKNPAFWDLIFEPRLLQVVRTILGPRVAYLQHSDLHVGFSAVTWHRDSVDRRTGQGADWDEATEPYALVRVGIYLHSLAESGFALGLLPGSHRPRAHSNRGDRALEGAAGWLAQARAILGRDSLRAQAAWVGPQRGDAVLFDPRILHSGSFISGPKYSLFLAYGVPGRHFARHHAYYRRVRQELGYTDLDPALVARLQEAGLYAEPDPEVEMAAAFRPSRLRTLLGRIIRPS